MVLHKLIKMTDIFEYLDNLKSKNMINIHIIPVLQLQFNLSAKEAENIYVNWVCFHKKKDFLNYFA